MNKLFEWIYENKRKGWTVYFNGKTISSIKTKEDAIEHGRNLALKTAKELQCVVDLLIQDRDGGIEIIERIDHQKIKLFS